MKGFTSGVMFTAGMILFGKSMYELGRLSEKRENLRLWEELSGNLKEVVKNSKDGES